MATPIKKDSVQDGNPVKQIATTLTELDERKRALVKEYSDQDKVPVILAPMYAVYFGNVMTVTINGISIRFRVDGSTQRVPATYADEIARRRMAIDIQLRRQQRMSNVQNNKEQNPGELALY